MATRCPRPLGIHEFGRRGGGTGWAWCAPSRTRHWQRLRSKNAILSFDPGVESASPDPWSILFLEKKSICTINLVFLCSAHGICIRLDHLLLSQKKLLVFTRYNNENCFLSTIFHEIFNPIRICKSFLFTTWFRETRFLVVELHPSEQLMLQRQNDKMDFGFGISFDARSLVTYNCNAMNPFHKKKGCCKKKRIDTLA